MKILTADGSYTLKSEFFDESYHSSSCGALRESMQKHIIPAFDAINRSKEKKEIRILDICFGLGYNTLASIAYAKNFFPELKLKIFSPEIDYKLVCGLGSFEYPKEIYDASIVQALSSNLYFEDDKYEVEIKIGDAREILKNIHREFDVIYQDAFSPSKNPYLWSYEYFCNIKELMPKKSIVTTYSQATAVKMSMYEAGLNIYEVRGEGVRGSVIAANFELTGFREVDIAAKIKNSPKAKSLRDCEIELSSKG